MLLSYHVPCAASPLDPMWAQPAESVHVESYLSRLKKPIHLCSFCTWVLVFPVWRFFKIFCSGCWSVWDMRMCNILGDHGCSWRDNGNACWHSTSCVEELARWPETKPLCCWSKSNWWVENELLWVCSNITLLVSFVEKWCKWLFVCDKIPIAAVYLTISSEWLCGFWFCGVRWCGLGPCVLVDHVTWPGF